MRRLAFTSFFAGTRSQIRFFSSRAQTALNALRELPPEEINAESIDKILRRISGINDLREILSQPIVNNETLLHHGVRQADFSLVKKLVGFDAKIDVTCPDQSSKQTPIELAKSLLTKASNGNDTKEKIKDILAFLETRSALWESYSSSVVRGKKVSFNRVMRLLCEIEEIHLPQGVSPAIKVVLLYGQTQMGKSTLGNYLCGTNYVEEENKGVKYAKPLPGAEEVFATGGHRESETRFPKAIGWNGKILIDMPGTGDSREAEEAICIAVSKRLLVKSLAAKNLSITSVIFITPYDEIVNSATADRYIATLDSMANMARGEARKNLLFVLTKPPEKPLLKDVFSQLEDLHGIYSRSQTLAQYNAAVLTDLMINKAMPVIIGNVTRPDARNAIQVAVERLSALPSDSFQIDPLYAEHESLFLEVIEKVNILYLGLVMGINNAEQTLKNHADKIDGKLREKAGTEKEMGEFNSQGYEKLKKDFCNQKIELENAAKIINLRLDKIEKEIEGLEAEIKTLREDKQEVPVLPPVFSEFNANVRTASSPPYFEDSWYVYSTHIATLVSQLRYRAEQPISSWSVAEAINCDFTPGYFTPGLFNGNKFVSFEGSWDAIRQRFTPDSGHHAEYAKRSLETGQLEGMMVPKGPGAVKLKLSVFAYKKDLPQTVSRLKTMEEQIKNLKERSCKDPQKSYLADTLIWIQKEIEHLEAAIKILEDKPEQHKKRVDDLKKLNDEINKLEVEKVKLEASLEDRRRELRVNSDYFERVGQWIVKLGLNDFEELKDLKKLKEILGNGDDNTASSSSRTRP